MPYIPPSERPEFDKILKPVLDFITEKKDLNLGQLNYMITNIIIAYAAKTPSYTHFSSCRAVLDDVRDEFTRRIMDAYEDKKKEVNGDVY